MDNWLNYCDHIDPGRQLDNAAYSRHCTEIEERRSFHWNTLAKSMLSLVYLSPLSCAPHWTSLQATRSDIYWLLLRAISIIDPFIIPFVDASDAAHTNAAIASGGARTPAACAPFVRIVMIISWLSHIILWCCGRRCCAWCWACRGRRSRC